MSFRRPIRVVTFDAMKTFINLRQSPGKIYSDFAREHFELRVDAALLDDAFVNNFRRWDKQWPCFGFLQAKKSASSMADWQKRWWTNVVTATFSDAAADGIDENVLNRLTSDLYDYFGTAAPWVLDPSAKSLFETFTRKGVSMAVLSNNDSRLRQLLAAFRLDHYFRALFLSGEIGVAKPNEALFRLVERIMVADANEILHVGDDLEKDYSAARAAGWRAVLHLPSVGSKTAGVNPDHIITDLGALKSKV